MGIARFLAGFFSPAKADSGVDDGRAAEGCAVFECGPVPLGVALEAIASDPARRRALSAIRDLLAAIPKASKPTFVDRVVQRFALTVVDLPASEKAHHARPWGLLDHSLEVAQLALERAQDRRFPATHDPVANHELQPRWTYAVFLSALLHDVGKVCDVDVTAPAGATWNPFIEPLAAYLLRHGLAPGQALDARMKHRVGRGNDAHLLHNPYFWSTVVPLEARSYLGPVQSQLLLQQSEAYALLKDLVGQADKLSSMRAARRATSMAIRREPTQAVAPQVASPQPMPTPLAAAPVQTPPVTVPPPLAVVVAPPASTAPTPPATPPIPPAGTNCAAPSAVKSTAPPARATRALYPALPKSASPVAAAAAAARTASRNAPQSAPAAPSLKVEDLGVNAATILQHVKECLGNGQLQMNGRHSDVLLTDAHAYVVLPIAIEKVCNVRHYRKQFAAAPDLYLSMLGAHPLVERTDAGDVQHSIYPHPGARVPSKALRINLAAWLSRAEIEAYGVAREPVVVATPAERARRQELRLAKREAS